MGNTTSRPILHGVESTLLRMAQLVDTVVRAIERLLSSLFTLCLPATLYQEFQLDESKQLRACDEQGVCYIPATRAKQHADLKQKREERLKRRKLRAEWAAAGLDVNEMEKQELAKGRKQQQKEKETPPDGRPLEQEKVKETIEAMLGVVPLAPAPRPEKERETRAERERGKLWIMGNVQPKKTSHTPPTGRGAAPAEIKPISPERKERRAVLEAVREASHHEHQREYAMQGHGGRIASGASEHGDISYQIVASSKDSAEDHLPMEMIAPKPRRHKRSITPHGIMPTDAEPPMVAALTASRLQTSPSRPTHKPHSASLPAVSMNAPEFSRKGPTISQPTLIQPTAHRLRKSLNVLDMEQRPEPTSRTAVGPLEKRAESPRFYNRKRVSLDSAAIGLQIPIPPVLPNSAASSDVGSIASRHSLVGQSISRSSTPPCVMNLADRACKSRWEASAKERKVWKGEVNRITLEKLHQTSKRHLETAQRDQGADLRLQKTVSAASVSSNLAVEAERRLRRASLQPSKPNRPGKMQRRSSQKA